MMSNKPPTLISYENSSEEDDALEDKVVQSYYSHTVLETNIDEHNNVQMTSFEESSLARNVYTSPRYQAFNDDNVIENKMFNIKIESLEKSHLTDEFDIDNSISVLESKEGSFNPIKSASVSPEKIKFDISDSDKEHNESKDLKENFKRKKVRSSRKSKMSSLKRLVSYGLGAGDTTIHDEGEDQEEASPSGSSSSPSSPPTAAPSPVPLSQRDRILASTEQQLIPPSAEIKMATTEIEEVDQIEPNEIRPPPLAPSVARNRDTSGNWSDYIFDEDEDNSGQGEGGMKKGEIGMEDEIFSLQAHASTSLPLTTSTDFKNSNSTAAEDILLDQYGNPLLPTTPQIKQPRIFWDPLGPVWSLAAGLQKIHASDPTSIQKPIDVLLPEPPGRCSEALQAKFRTFYERAAREARSDPNAFSTNGDSSNVGASLDMNAVICDNKAFRNPSIYEKLLQYCDIDDGGTNAIPDPAYFAAPPASKRDAAAGSRGGIYNVKRATGKRLWAAASFYEELARAQKVEMERWEKERTIQRSALNAGAAPGCATSCSSSILPTINSAPPVSAALLESVGVTISSSSSVGVAVRERSTGKHGSRKAVAETTTSKKKRSSGSAEKGSSPHSRSPGKSSYSAAFNNPFGISPSALQNVKTRKSKWDKPIQGDSMASETIEATRDATDS